MKLTTVVSDTYTPITRYESRLDKVTLTIELTPQEAKEVADAQPSGWLSRAIQSEVRRKIEGKVVGADEMPPMFFYKPGQAVQMQNRKF